MNWHRLRIALIGPLPPPAGGMGDQIQQLTRLMRDEGAEVTVIQNNPPYPPWVEKIRGARALSRLPPYVAALWRAAGAADIFHVMANSGLSWHLLAAPAIWVARARGVPCVVSYHGGEAEAFLARSFRIVAPTLRAAQVLAVPSTFLQQVFGRYGIDSRVVPNVVDLSLFTPPVTPHAGAPRLVVARNLEAIYDIPTALRALAAIRERIPGATLSVAGSGSEQDALRALAERLGILSAVEFTGRISRAQMASLLAASDLMLNPSTADNMPISILEAMASGLPIVSTRVGGIPHLLEDGRTALLVEPRDPAAMGRAALRLLQEPSLAAQIRTAARASVQQYSWPRVRESVENAYDEVLRRGRHGRT